MAGTNWGHKSGVLRSQVSFQTSSLLKNCWKLDEMHPVIIFFFFLGGGGGGRAEGGRGRTEEAICLAPYLVTRGVALLLQNSVPMWTFMRHFQ